MLIRSYTTMREFEVKDILQSSSELLDAFLGAVS